MDGTPGGVPDGVEVRTTGLEDLGAFEGWDPEGVGNRFAEDPTSRSLLPQRIVPSRWLT